MGDERGQASVELVAALPALLLAALVALQLLAAGYAMTLADGAAEAGALALASGEHGSGGGPRRAAGMGGRRRRRLDPGRDRDRAPAAAVAAAPARRPAHHHQRRDHEAGAMSSNPLTDAPTVLVTAVGDAEGSRGAAAALACAGADVDLATLHIDVGGKPPRPTLLASAAARQLEERLVAHLPRARVAARGQVCHLAVPDEPEGLEAAAAAVTVARGALAVLHLSPPLLQSLLEGRGRCRSPPASSCAPTCRRTGPCSPWWHGTCSAGV